MSRGLNSERWKLKAEPTERKLHHQPFPHENYCSTPRDAKQISDSPSGSIPEIPRTSKTFASSRVFRVHYVHCVHCEHAFELCPLNSQMALEYLLWVTISLILAFRIAGASLARLDIGPWSFSPKDEMYLASSTSSGGANILPDLERPRTLREAPAWVPQQDGEKG